MAYEDKVSMCSQCKMQYLYAPDEKPKRDTCERCGSKLIHTNITAEEMFLIEHTSKDKEFVNAMIELKKNDIVEYQTRISQFRSQAKADGCYTSPREKRKPHCPNCNSTNIKPISSTERAASIIGLGLFSKKINKSFKCLDCKYTW